MKFVFTFEKLLEHKKNLENAARRDWVTAQNAVDVCMAAIKSMYQQIEDARKSVAQLVAGGGTQAARMGTIDVFIDGQKIRIERERQKARELMMVAEEKQELLKKAAVERKTLEKLKERQFEDYKLKRKKLELKANDELVTTRFKPSEGR